MAASQSPAVVIIARHGPRLDAADQSWHLSTPTPYDPPLTYGGWNQSRALGVRIASLLKAREKRPVSPSTSPPSEAQTVPVTTNGDGFMAYDFAQTDGLGKRKDITPHDGSGKRTKRKHRVVIHTSPFLRCIQTSVAIGAGMAQYHPAVEVTGNQQSTTSSGPKHRDPASLHSASPRLRASEGSMSPRLAPIPEPRIPGEKHDLTHDMARRAMEAKPHPRRPKLRVDAFLGEWLNPQYFEHITPPPPSALMVATAKAELAQNVPIAAYTPSISTKSSNSNLWGGGGGGVAVQQQAIPSEGTLDGPGHSPVSPVSSKRERASSASSAGSLDSDGARSAFRRGHLLNSNPPPVNKSLEPTLYVPPAPHYAVSSADKIPRGYVEHARKACLDVDYQWDSSRAPQNWVDGGKYGEEWSAMHKRFRSGLNHLVEWYSQHGPDERKEDALGLEQVENHQDEDPEEEDLVVILVTHGAGSNALIGALTGQPVLLDVGMASLTMAVRKADAEPLPSSEGPPATRHSNTDRRRSLDLALSSIYDMKLVSSSEHLRPDSDARRISGSSASTDQINARAAARPMFRENHWNMTEPPRHTPNSALGSMRRPSVVPSAPVPIVRSESEPAAKPREPVVPVAPSLWTPPTGRTPILAATKLKEERDSIFGKLNDANGQDVVIDSSTSPPDSRPALSNGANGTKDAKIERTRKSQPKALAIALNGGFDRAATVDGPTSPKDTRIVPIPLIDGANGAHDTATEPFPDSEPPTGRKGSVPPTVVAEHLPPNLSRGLSQKGLWGATPKGARVERQWGEPKRRWSAAQKPQ